ncbi:MAG: hypothetical protein JW902_09485, partial [Syntrophaceae bacterium]|nr:hypothetical protein [Syntrophaceae bacterium]
LRKKNYIVEQRPLIRSALLAADMVLLTNSLMGAVPVISLDGKPLPNPNRLWIEINDHLFQGSNWRKDLRIDGPISFSD